MAYWEGLKWGQESNPFYIIRVYDAVTGVLYTEMLDGNYTKADLCTGVKTIQKKIDNGYARG